jgi:FAD/FMN-containing dehydrogenase
MVGTEATCGLILEAQCTLIPSPQERSLVLVGYPDAPAAATLARRMLVSAPPRHIR